MIRRHLLLHTTLLGATAMLPRSAGAQGGWAPDRAVRIVVPVAAGGSLDILGRLLARHLSPRLGQPVVAENLPGAGSNIAFETVARARPDGLTLLVGSDPLTINPALYPRVGYDPVRDFAPIIEAVRAPQVLVVNPRSPVSDLAGFVEWAKEQEGRLTVASQGNGSIGHLAGALFAQRADLRFTHVPYRGGGPAVIDVVAGHVEALFVTLPAAIEHIRGGRLRALAVTGTERSAAIPAVPTVAEALLPGFDVVTWQGVLAPAGTPQPAIDRLATDLAAVLALPGVADDLTRQGFTVTGHGPDRFAALIRAEAERWPTVVRSTGARPE
ncbi:tripartite tricarboxylate transporter substrate binding protein [Roseomonas terrae]|jgi:tripartite-type tricarboxylate transporter receptor subunit TctC|uniref:Tripartite tricarboxylate transporter substrate binding protein n=1 Tax=Neoroseomonas terrae TaxID=424799 RepID=A0ABS5EJU0_9PROT|nr:tripartite tricarboxylate transporter substrate binding protein [Neoroseomonas terrae]MBR0651287.1 tripartite tricarboxylate transporter substrate binding protein [Neoroseomonas terrae]